MEDRAGLEEHLLAVDAIDAGSADDDVHLLLAGLRFVVRMAFRVGGSSNQLIPNASTPSSRRTKRTAPPGPAGSSSSILTTEYPIYMRKTPKVVSLLGALPAAASPSARTRRVSSGSMIPSSQRRAVE